MTNIPSSPYDIFITNKGRLIETFEFDFCDLFFFFFQFSMSVGFFSDHVEHVECSVKPQLCVPYTLCCRVLRPLAPHPHSCFRGPYRITGCLNSPLPRLETIKMENRGIIFRIEHPRLPCSARIHSLETGHCLPREGFMALFLIIKKKCWTVLGRKTNCNALRGNFLHVLVIQVFFNF